MLRPCLRIGVVPLWTPPSSRSFSTPVSGTGVHLSLRPRPRDLTESRQILHALERFGEVQMYRDFSHDPSGTMKNLVTALFRDRSAADAAIEASPLELSVQPAIPFEIPTPTTPPPSEDPSAIPHRTAPPADPRPIIVTVSRSTYDHEKHIRLNRRYGNWNPELRTLMADDLSRKIDLPGLRDWGLGEDERVTKEGRLFQKREQRRREREREREEETGRGGLRALWEEGRRLREGGESERTERDG
ncbi:MAG: hypothetical protein M1817_000309 [Caeruleum heppii]|nr:MAG: hypothetical protein M1817_000309 [Caeruleum heppii]